MRMASGRPVDGEPNSCQLIKFTMYAHWSGLEYQRNRNGLSIAIIADVDFFTDKLNNWFDRSKQFTSRAYVHLQQLWNSYGQNKMSYSNELLQLTTINLVSDSGGGLQGSGLHDIARRKQMLTFRSLDGSALKYLSDQIEVYRPTRALRSSNSLDLVVPPNRVPRRSSYSLCWLFL